MRIVRDTLFVAPEDRGAVAAIGNFDGVHLGHQSVIDLARDIAKQSGAPLGVMTFEPHPRSFFAPDAPPFRLMNAAAKANRLAGLGVETLYEVAFNQGLAELDAQRFAQEIISNRLGLAHVLVGSDFRFGKDRQGSAADLEAFGAEMGFGVTIVPPKQISDFPVSSTAIRSALSEGRPGDAAAMLGHWHRLEGEVITGHQRGRDLGYPTANIALSELHLPAFGVYAVKVNVLNGPHAGQYDGASSIGIRPMFDGDVPNCETFLFDFEGDLYGSQISVALVAYLRPELTFDGLDALITQMDEDCAQCREILADV